MGRKHGFSWSWKRASGLSSARQKIAKATGIPTTKSGRQRKMGAGCGCLVVVAALTTLASAAVLWAGG